MIALRDIFKRIETRWRILDAAKGMPGLSMLSARQVLFPPPKPEEIAAEQGDVSDVS